MKKSFILAGLLVGLTATAQYEKRVGINTDSPRASLEVKAVTPPDGRTQGILFPHISDEEKKKWQPNDTTGLVAGTVIWNTDLKCLDYFDGEKWQCSDGSNPYYPPVNPTTDPTIKADVWDRTHYIGSFSHNGANIDGEIANTGANALTLQIPYNQATVGGAYNAITVTRTVKDRSGANKTLTLNIPAGIFTAAKGFLNATITVGNGTTDVYKVKQLAANTEETIATFAFSINGNVSNVNLIASGGVLDKKFNIQTNEELEHQFIYVPESKIVAYDYRMPDIGKPYEHTWLNNYLGSTVALVGYDLHNVKANVRDGFKGMHYVYQHGRDSDGHEVVYWDEIAQKPKMKYPEKGTYIRTFVGVPYDMNIDNDPCPIDYHTMRVDDFLDYLSTRIEKYEYNKNYPNNKTTLGFAANTIGYVNPGFTEGEYLRLWDGMLSMAALFVEYREWDDVYKYTYSCHRRPSTNYSFTCGARNDSCCYMPISKLDATISIGSVSSSYLAVKCVRNY